MFPLNAIMRVGVVLAGPVGVGEDLPPHPEMQIPSAKAAHACFITPSVNLGDTNK
jgi:hypothetical protein